MTEKIKGRKLSKSFGETLDENTVLTYIKIVIYILKCNVYNINNVIRLS